MNRETAPSSKAKMKTVTVKTSGARNDSGPVPAAAMKASTRIVQTASARCAPGSRPPSLNDRHPIGAEGQTAQEEADQTAEETIMDGDVHRSGSHHHEHGHTKQDQRQGRRHPEPGQHQKHGREDQISVELDTDRPAWEVPGHIRMEPQRMDQQDIGQDREGRPRLGEGRPRIGATQPGLQHQGREFHHQEKPQHRRMKRPEPAEPQGDETAEIRQIADAVTIGVRDHEATENKEEVHEQVTVPDQRELIKMPGGMVMKQCDEDGAKPSPTVKRVKTQLFLQGAPKIMESRRTGAALAQATGIRPDRPADPSWLRAATPPACAGRDIR